MLRFELSTTELQPHPQRKDFWNVKSDVRAKRIIDNSCLFVFFSGWGQLWLAVDQGGCPGLPRAEICGRVEFCCSVATSSHLQTQGPVCALVGICAHTCKCSWVHGRHVHTCDSMEGERAIRPAHPRCCAQAFFSENALMKNHWTQVTDWYGLKLDFILRNQPTR